MRFIISVILIGLLAAGCEHYGPWWTIAIASCIVVAFTNTSRPFWAGFLGIGIFWLAAILFYDMPNQHILSTKMAALFSLANYYLFITVNVLIGGLVGGLSACCGKMIRKGFHAMFF